MLSIDKHYFISGIKYLHNIYIKIATLNEMNWYGVNIRNRIQ